MASLYTDEDFSGPVAFELREKGHDVLNALQDGRAGLPIPDDQVLRRATVLGRIVLTRNGGDFINLHKSGLFHCGIIVSTDDRNFPRQANRIHTLLSSIGNIDGRLLRVNRPHPSEPQ